MKKILLVCMLLTVIVFSFAACGENNNPPSNNEGNDNEPPVHTHSFGEWEVTVKPTCTKDGTKVRYCSCGEKQSEIVAMLGHTPANSVEENVVDSTCYSVGSKDMVVYCSAPECHAFIEKSSVMIEKKTHTPADAVEENRVNPTYEKDGSYQMVVYCSVAECCAELARTTYTLDMLVHHPGTAVIENEVAATCTKNGSYDEVIYCLDEDCGHKELSRKTVITDTISHTVGTAVEENKVDATCYAEGSYDSVVNCAVCGTELSRTTVTLQKIAHSPANVVVENRVEATCTADGSCDEVIYCSVENCKAQVNRITKVIDALGHTEVIDIAVDATCTETGLTEGKHCSTCGVVLVTQEVIEVEHNYVNSICTICGDNTREFAGGTGTENHPYQISTVNHLHNIRFYPSAHYELINDINFTSYDFYNGGEYWEPIDDFTGSFNGNNYSIDGLKISRSFAGETVDGVTRVFEYFGLFSSVDGDISNLILSNVNIQVYVSQSANHSTDVYVGAIAGHSEGNISNCNVSGKITATGKTDWVGATLGGVVGVASANCSIESCINYATLNGVCTKTTYNYSGTYISSSYVTVGGIVGNFNGIDVANCINYGAVTANSIDSPYVAGIIGKSASFMVESQVRNCYNYGAIEASSTPPAKIDESKWAYAGGIVAYVAYDDTSVINCGNHANVTAKGWNTYVGGVAGSISNSSPMIRCFNIGNVLSYDTDTSSADVYGNYYAGGITGNGGLIDQCYNTGSVTVTGKDYVKAGGITVCTFEKISNCYNTGTIIANLNATDSKSGGIIVDCPAAIEYCYNLGELTGTKKGGIACTVYDGTSNSDNERHVLYCYYVDNIILGVYETLNYCTKLTYQKSDSALKQQSTYANFDFDNIWTISDGEYPYPQLKNNNHITN